MMDGIKSFQQDNSLYAEGVMRPGDATEAAINEQLSEGGKGKSKNKKSGKYIWHTRGDSKVRGEHAKRNGKVFDWANPPEGGHPGEDYNCRCWAEDISGEEGVNIAEGLTQEVISPINDAPKRWGDKELWHHFQHGNGEPKTLEEIGLLGPVVNYARKIMFRNVEKQLMDLIKKNGEGSFWDDWHNSYNFRPFIYSLGGVTISGLFRGKAIKRGNLMYVDVIVNYIFWDEYTDPASIREKVRGTSSPSAVPEGFGGESEMFVTDAGGTPYIISGRWDTKLTGSFEVK